VSVTGEKHASWPHQLDCLAFVLALFHEGRHGAMVAMDPGTGKTRVAIEVIRSLAAKLVLVICPMRVIDVWEYQLRQHASFPYLFRGLNERAGPVSQKARIAREAIALARATQQTCILAINYESVWLEPFASLILHTAWSLVIADEGHRLKSPQGKCSRFMGRLARRSAHRLILTGTPLPHTKLDAWAQYRFLDGSIFDETYSSFKVRYAVWGGFEGRVIKGWREEEDFARRFGSIAFRVSKAVLDLPPEMDQELYTELSPAGRRIYDELEANFLAWLGTTPEDEITVANALVLLLRLQQLTGGTLKDDQNIEHAVDAAKERLLADWLEDMPRDEPIVVFARFMADLDAILRACAQSGHTASEVSGRSPHGIADWQAGKTNVLAAQIQTASEGQDFTRARYCAFYSMGFSLFQYIQARARVHRAGQKRPVTYYHFLVRNTVDEKVLRAVQNRWEVVETVLQEMKHYAIRNSGIIYRG
jgi:SNF2 family DNA or RNA helicase